jgi:hypothetical protein
MRKFGLILFLGIALYSYSNAQYLVVSKANSVSIKSPFKTDFNLAFGSSNKALAKVAELIEEGRKKKDVETLLSAALILFLEEKNTGFKTSFSGLSILKEATEFAIKSKNKNLVKLVATYWDDPMFGNDSKYAYELTYDE